MAKTAAERQRERRARLRQDEQLYEIYKAKDRQRKKDWRANLSPDDLRFVRLKTQVSMQQLRQRLKNNADGGDEMLEECAPYKCRATLGKAKHKAKTDAVTQIQTSDDRNHQAVAAQCAPAPSSSEHATRNFPECSASKTTWSSSSSRRKPRKAKGDSTEERNNPSNYCWKCKGYYWDDDRNDAESWIQCPICFVWFHETCAGVYGKAYYDIICEDCAD